MLFNFCHFLSRLYKFPNAQDDRIQTTFSSNEENLKMHQKPPTNATNQNGFSKIYLLNLSYINRYPSRLQRWSFFYNDGMVMFFSNAPLPSMVFQWFYYPWTITIECFFTDQPLKSMVFRWFSQIQVRWSAMVLTLKKTNKCA